jgi:hypothetical protein
LIETEEEPMKRTEKVVLVAFLVAASGCQVFGQIGLQTGVFAGGGGMFSGGSFAAAGTIGQGVIGRSIGVTYAASAGFWGDGAVILDVEGPIVQGIPAEFALKQNFPNPFNPGTTIAYELPGPADVRLSVYDMLGREVSLLVNERLEAGRHEVRLDAAGLSSGVYLYRMRAGDFVQTRKCVVLK